MDSSVPIDMTHSLAQFDTPSLLAGGLAVALLACVVLLVRVRQSVRRMARRHEQTLRAMVSRHNHVEATLSSMLDGVLAVDIDGRLISVNDAAHRLLGVRRAGAGGRAYTEVVAHEALTAFIADTLATTKPMRAEIAIDERRYQTSGTSLRNADGERLGSLIVLHDVTRLRQLEAVRRDFVANASHEIKTPVTAIKVAAETLSDAAEHDPEAAQHFVGVINRQSDRLSALVEDLLCIARLEDDDDHTRTQPQTLCVRAVLDAAVETCRGSIESRNATVDITCQGNVEAPIKRDLLEQAVVNLIDNAIKYSDDGASVQVTAERMGGEVIISVCDQGMGITDEHLPRIFERFYRTDRARSRQLGGTGLGLAIVRHVAVSHGGRVSVDSTPGSGSTFRIHIPAG